MGAMKALAIERSDKSERIAHLNDLLRQKNIGGIWTASENVMGLPKDIFNKILRRIQSTQTFKRAGRTARERDFGSITVEGIQLVWHIQYLKHGDFSQPSEDPISTLETTRRLVILFTEEVNA